MRDKLVAFDGSTFFVSDEAGDAHGHRPLTMDGLFFADTRHLSRWELFVDGEPVAPVTSRPVEYYAICIVGTPGPVSTDAAPRVTIRRSRLIGDCVHEDVNVDNNTNEARRLEVQLRYAADFADVLDAKAGVAHERSVQVSLGDNSVTMAYANRFFRRATRVAFDVAGKIDDDSATFEVELQPHESWSLCVEISFIDGDRLIEPRIGHGGFGKLHPAVPTTLDEWLADAPQLITDDHAIPRTYRTSVLDLVALRYRPFLNPDLALPAAGLPRFMTVLGRDSLLASYMTLPFDPTLARISLEALADTQAVADDPFRDAEPGKIVHEVRRGENAVLGDRPEDLYYGAHDTTPLFIILLDEYQRWTGDNILVDALEPTARAALRWIEEEGDTDGDGYLEYQTRSSAGHPNHCWKDSDNSMLFADGTRAQTPIATCEIQGYAYDARRRMARLARERWDDEALAARLEADAAALAARFAEDFWVEHRGHPALALDRHKRQVDSLTSNIGHLLWSGILDHSQAARVADLLLERALFTGWGVRTMSTEDAGYNPMEYHNGSVWPHDTALAAEGLRRYGFRGAATTLAMAVLEAAAGFGHRLPELFAGFDRTATHVPVEYPTANRPQLWSASAPLLALRTLLGLGVVEGEVIADPSLPEGLHLGVERLWVGGRRVDVNVR